MMLLATINWHSVMFLIFALAACGFAAAVVLTPNVVRMAFYLTLSLGATAGLFSLAGEWVAAALLGSALLGLLLLSSLTIESWSKPRADLDKVSVADGQTSTP